MIDYVKQNDIAFNFKNGYAETQVLAGVYPGVRVFRCVLKAGNTVTPETFSQKLQVLCITNGEGYISTFEKAFNINELCFFIANLDEAYTIHAAKDIIITKFVVDLTASDMEVFNKTHVVLPFFRKVSDCIEYWQDCKGADTRSWRVLPPKSLTRILFGVVKGSGEGEGTIEKGHPAVAQWSVILDDSELVYTVEDESIDLSSGDIGYVKAGLDHSLVAKTGKKVNYIWFEHYVQEKDYIVVNPHR
ncbi:MAG: hypothetical protein ABFC57_15475 [Veillonellales bacterium]